ncbi:MAG: hypothetical protein II828_04660 [Clostridia bacterium]|nr:hypothetical protein [Clostridia bacterium]
MSERERAVQLLKEVPDYKIRYVIAYMQGLIADEAADDAFCEKLYQDYLDDPDSEKDEFITLEEFKKTCIISDDSEKL